MELANHFMDSVTMLSDLQVFGPPIDYDIVMAQIKQDYDTYQHFLSFPKKHQEKIIQFMQGQRGLMISYDSFFKHIMNPEIHPERLEDFLSTILHEQVQIKAVLPREGNRMVDSGSLVIMDIIVELSDGSIIDVEMQKIGYAFPGERSSCYVADCIMRQYNRIRTMQKEANRTFSYQDMKPVFLIILMEKSSKEFTAVSPHYIHKECVTYDSGAKLKSLSQVTYISLDTFRKVVHNIDTRMHAWLTFLSSDEPADIIRLLETYPEFEPLYRDLANFRRNPKELISMYSEALAILDRNTEIYMLNELQKETEDLKKETDELRKESDELRKESDELRKGNDELRKGNDELRKGNDELRKGNDLLHEQNATLQLENTSLQDANASLQDENASLQDENTSLQDKNTSLQAEIESLKAQLNALRQ